MKRRSLRISAITIDLNRSTEPFPLRWISRLRLLRAGAEGLAFLRAVDAAEADTLRVGVVQNFDGVVVEDGDGLTLILWL